MNITRQDLKNGAKEILREKYWQIFIVPLIFFIATNAITAFVSYVAVLLVNIFVANPFYVSYSKFLKQSSENEGISYAVLWDTVKNNYSNIVKTAIIRDLYIFLWSLPAIIGLYLVMATILCLPGVADAMPELEMLKMIPQNVVVSMGIVGGVVTVGGIILMGYKSYCYLMVNYILADSPEKEWRSVLAESQDMMNKKKGFAFIMDLSFIGWYLLCSLVAGMLVTFAGKYSMLLAMIGTMIVQVYRDMTVTQLYLQLNPKTVSDGQTENFEFNQ